MALKLRHVGLANVAFAIVLALYAKDGEAVPRPRPWMDLVPAKDLSLDSKGAKTLKSEAKNGGDTVSSLPWMLLSAAEGGDATLKFLKHRRPAEDNLVGVAKSLGLNSFLQTLSKANLTKLMTGTGNFTVFAPSDVAFSKLSARLRTLITNDADFCRQLMLYHIVKERIPSALFQDDMLLESLANETIVEFDWTEWYKVRINAYDIDTFDYGMHEVTTASGAAVRQRNQWASNGIIHVIDQVMFPFPNITVVERIQIETDLSTFEFLLWNSTVEEIINPIGSFTVFAPTNEAFAQIPQKAYAHLVNDKALLKKVIERHVALSSYYTASFYDNKNITALGGSEMVVVQGPGGTDVYSERVYGHVLERDLTCSDGVLHKIDSLLWDWRDTISEEGL